MDIIPMHIKSVLKPCLLQLRRKPQNSALEYLATASFLFDGYDKMWCWKEVPVIFKLVVQTFHLKLGLLNRRAHVSGIIACCLFNLKLFLLKIVDVFVITFFPKVHVIVFFSSFIIAQVNALLFKLIIVRFQCSIINLVLILI